MSKSAFQQLITTSSGSGAIGFVYASNNASITMPSGVAVLYQYYDTGITITITPQFADSYILLMGTVSVGGAPTNQIGFRMYRSGPDNIGPISIGAPANLLSGAMFPQFYPGTAGMSYPITGRDLAGTTQAITYSLQGSADITAYKINDSNSGTSIRGITQIIALEISEL